MTFCLLMTSLYILSQMMRCNRTWNLFCLPVMSLNSPSAQRKKEVMFLSGPHTNYLYPTITLKGQKLQSVDKFTYFDGTLSRNVLINEEADARISKASTAIGRLRKKAVVRTTLLYGSKT